MVDCEQVRIAAMAIADGDSPTVEPCDVEAHLTSCSDCRAAVEQLDIENLLPTDLQRVAGASPVWSGLRKRLDVRGDAPAPSSVQTSRPAGRRGVWSVGLVACLLIAATVRMWMLTDNGDDPAGAQPQDSQLIVLAPLDQSIASKPLPPFAYETRADVVAIAVMDAPQARDGRQVIGMNLVTVLKGGQQLGPLESADGVVPFGCIMPAHPNRSSDMYKPGERVAVYLQKNDDGWATLQMTHLTEQNEFAWRQRVQPFLDVLLAAEADDPEQRYIELLIGRPENGGPDRVEVEVTAQLSESSYYALQSNPDPRAAAPLRDMLMASVSQPQRLVAAMSTQQTEINQQSVDSQQPTLNQSQGPKLQNPTVPTRSQRALSQTAHVAQEAMATFPNTPLDFVRLLARMHDAKTALPLMTHISRLPEAERQPFLALLPDLCTKADADTLRIVQAMLKTLVDSRQPDQQDDYFQTLDRTRAAIDRILED